MFQIYGSFIIIYVILIVLFFASLWKLFEKAGEPGWAAIVPIYNVIIWVKIIEKPWWWFFLICTPFLNIIWSIWATNLFVKKFGKEVGFTVGCLFLPFIFYPILAFSNDVQIEDNLENTIDKW